MGYEISVDHAEIHIRKENFGAVLNAIALIPDRMAWTELADIQRIAKSGDITEMFDHLGWPVEFDSDGNIVRMEFDSSKMGDEEVWLGAIAPYVESGCIQVRGEDGDLWRWALSGGKLIEIRPEITWPEVSSKLLGGLKGIDPETYEALRNYPIYCSGEGALTVNLLESRNHVLVADALQGCIQRACERREWPFHVAYYPPEGPNTPYYQAYIWPALKCPTVQEVA